MDHHLTLFSPLSALFWIRNWFKNCFSLILNKCKISVKLFELKLKICTLITYWLWWWCTEAKPQKVSDYGPNLFVWKVLNTIYFYHFSYLFIYFPRYTFLIVAGIGPFLIYCQKLRYTCFFTMQEMHSSTSREQLCTLIMQHVQVHTKPEQNVINNIAVMTQLQSLRLLVFLARWRPKWPSGKTFSCISVYS